jgi:PhnB protein
MRALLHKSGEGQTDMATTQVVPYLFFGGRCDEAIAFYTETLGAKIEALMRYDQLPDSTPTGNLPEGFEHKVMHATLRVGESVMHVADGNTSALSFVGFSMSLTLPTEEEVRRAFSALAVEGKIEMPLGETFWSPCFGMVADKFGVDWILSVPTEEAP